MTSEDVTVGTDTITGVISEETFSIAVSSEPDSATITVTADGTPITPANGSYSIPYDTTSLVVTGSADGYTTTTKPYSVDVTYTPTPPAPTYPQIKVYKYDTSTTSSIPWTLDDSGQTPVYHPADSRGVIDNNNDYVTIYIEMGSDYDPTTWPHTGEYAAGDLNGADDMDFRYSSAGKRYYNAGHIPKLANFDENNEATAVFAVYDNSENPVAGTEFNGKIRNSLT